MGAAVAQTVGLLRWRCRRGMKELDLLLRRYVDEEFAQASSAHQTAFLALLEIPDPQIWSYCLGLEPPPTAVMASLIRRITRAGD